MPISPALNTAVSGLLTAQKGIDVISQNVSNVNTEGYTKKVFNQQSVVVAGAGVGVTDTLYTRVVDTGLLKDLRESSAILSNLSVKNEYMERIQNIFGEPGSSTELSSNFSSLQVAIENLIANPSDAATQNLALSSLESLVSKVNSLSSQMQTMRQEADAQIADLCDQVNNILSEMDSLNDSILRAKTLGNQSTADYEDQMDKLLLELSEIMDIQYFYRDSGELIVMTSSGESMLDANPHYMSHSSTTVTEAFTTYSGGNISGIMLDKEDITNSVTGGSMGANIQLRDSILPEMQAALDELTASFAEAINKVSNRATAYPDMTSSFTATRVFINPAEQNITLQSGDVKIALFDTDGSQIASVSLAGDLGFTSGTVEDLASTIQKWLKTDPNGPLLTNASVRINQEGKLELDLGTSNYGIGFLDEASSSVGTEAKDVSIGFDVNGDGTIDASYEGFSYFMGINDAVQTAKYDWAYDSGILGLNHRIPTNAVANISFSFVGEADKAIVQISPGDTLQTIVDKINKNPDLKDYVKASLVQEGSGYRLRIENIAGEQMEICEKGTNTGALDKLGIKASNSNVSSSVKVIANNINSGSMQFDVYSGEYFLSSSDNSIALQLCDILTKQQSFNAAGFMSAGGATFAQYAASFVSQIASDTASIETQLSYQSELTSTISYKSSEISGVNLDEELANLTIYELSYSAAARIISVSSEMLDDLFAAV